MSSALYIGIDISKRSHVACLLSSSLLERHHGSYERCPTLSFGQSRAGFEKLLALIFQYALSHECHILLENTGHYGRALEQYLQEKGLHVYQIHVQEKNGKSKSDKRDAQALAVLLYNQLERGILVSDKSEIVHRLTTPNETARLLRGLVQHRMELVHEATQRKNKLTSIVDEIFPEFTAVYADPNSPSALQLREQFPGPGAIMEAELDDLVATRKHTRPSRAQLAHLQELARHTIGTTDQSRLTCLLIEQKQLIIELKLLNEHIEQLNSEIEKVVMTAREGQILTSFPMIGPTHAAMLIASIGSIANFESAAKLRAYCGWSPHQNQTGTSKDSMTLASAGNRRLKHTLYLVAISAVRMDTPWRDLYNRLVPMKSVYDDRLGRYRGRMKVVGRVAGQIVNVIYVLLKRDYDQVAITIEGDEPPPPELYDAAKHRVKRHAAAHDHQAAPNS